MSDGNHRCLIVDGLRDHGGAVEDAAANEIEFLRFSLSTLRAKLAAAEAERDALKSDNSRLKGKYNTAALKHTHVTRELVKAAAERDALKKDAERYRWLRSSEWKFACPFQQILQPAIAITDEAIDAAMSQADE